MVRWSLLSLIAAAVFASLPGAGPALAQQSPRTVVAVNPEFRSYGERVGSGYLDVYANGDLCGRISFTGFASRTTDGGAELELGRPAQPAACGTEGAQISFMRGDGIPLVQTLALERGARLMLTSFNVVPGPAPTPLPGTLSQTAVGVTAEFRGYGQRAGDGFLDVYANGEPCGRLSFVDPAAVTADGGTELELDLPGQPAGCRTEGAEIVFRHSNSAPLVQTLTLKRGARLMLTRLQTVPGWGPDPLPTSDGRTLVAVTARLRGNGERWAEKYIDIYAEGQLCGRLSFADPAASTADGGVEFELGRPGQPAACNTEGATLSFRNDLGIALIQTNTLQRGARHLIASFTIPPPHTGSPGNSGNPGDSGPPEQTPLAPDAGTGVRDEGGGEARYGTAGTVLALVGVAALVATYRRRRA